MTERLSVSEPAGYCLSVIEELTAVMVTEATIFTFEWLFVLYGTFELAENHEHEEHVTHKRGKKVSFSTRALWHAPFLLFHAARVIALIFQVDRGLASNFLGLYFIAIF